MHEKVYAMISDLASSQISKYISLYSPLFSKRVAR